jgi:transcriptional regulator with XRE-family HTH domain
MKFSMLLTKLREQRNLSKAELATKISVSPGYVFILESGKRKPPTITRCRQIAEALRLDDSETAQLFESAAEERTKQEEREILQGSKGNMVEPSPAGIRRAVIRIDEKGNASIVSRDPGVSITFQYDDEPEFVGKAHDEAKIKHLSTPENRIKAKSIV